MPDRDNFGPDRPGYLRSRRSAKHGSPHHIYLLQDITAQISMHCHGHCTIQQPYRVLRVFPGSPLIFEFLRPARTILPIHIDFWPWKTFLLLCRVDSSTCTSPRPSENHRSIHKLLQQQQTPRCHLPVQQLLNSGQLPSGFSPATVWIFSFLLFLRTVGMLPAIDRQIPDTLRQLINHR